jgi:LL-diaminopimelate aminotransferase
MKLGLKSMTRINEHYSKLASSYLFSEIRKRVLSFESTTPGVKVIRLGIGDVTRALPLACRTALHKAIDEMGDPKTFRGYGPEQGYDFLRTKIALHDYHSRGIDSISPDDIFVSDGSKCDCGNIQEIFDQNSIIAVSDPVYPVYVDSNVMAGRSGTLSNPSSVRYEGIRYLECSEETGFAPPLPDVQVDVIYLCSPGNPTGTVITRKQLSEWVEYARTNKAIILFDAAYEAFIRNPDAPKSIFEIPGADEVAIEFRSFSKTAGFTGLRCAFTVVPERCKGYSKSGEPVSLRDLWFRRQSTKFNGVSYPVQRAAEACYSPEGMTEIKEMANFYLENAKLLRDALQAKGLHVFGGIDAPYIWVKTGGSSWDFFDKLLTECAVVCTPGAGFGRCGEGFVRFSAFSERDNIHEGIKRITKLEI